MAHYNDEIPSPQGLDSPQSDNHLYQTKPAEIETYKRHKVYSWTSSLEGYHNKAKAYAFRMLYNGRKVKYRITVNILRLYFVTDVPELRKHIQDLLQCLRRHKLIAYAILEVTRNEHQTGAMDRVHIHFLADTGLNKDALVELFQKACKAAKYSTKEHKKPFVENLEGLTDAEYWKVIKYFFKYDCRRKPILFKTGLSPQKTYQVGKFWVKPKSVKAGASRKTKKKYTPDPEPFTIEEIETSPPKVQKNVPVIQLPASHIKPSDKSKESFPFVIFCTHFENGEYEYCGHYHDCGQYQECRLIPSSPPDVSELPKESEGTPPVIDPSKLPHAKRWIDLRYIKDF